MRTGRAAGSVGLLRRAPRGTQNEGRITVITWIEELAFHLLFGVLQTVVKNPAKRDALKSNLLSIADDVYVAYGLTPPAHT